MKNKDLLFLIIICIMLAIGLSFFIISYFQGSYNGDLFLVDIIIIFILIGILWIIE